MAEVDVEEDRRRTGYLDALAFLAAALRDDYEGVEAILGNCTGYLVVASLASMLFAALEDRQVDVDAWIANEQAMMLGT